MWLENVWCVRIHSVEISTFFKKVTGNFRFKRKRVGGAKYDDVIDRWVIYCVNKLLSDFHETHKWVVKLLPYRLSIFQSPIFIKFKLQIIKKSISSRTVAWVSKMFEKKSNHFYPSEFATQVEWEATVWTELKW